MTAVEKAKELLDKYQFVEIANYTSMFEVKQCALIAVDEIRDNLPLITDIQNYWIEVKNEIEKL